MPKARKTIWDSFAIKAELKRRGYTRERLAQEAGVSPSAVGVCLAHKPSNRCNQFIAQLLQVPVQELWPDWFDEDGDLIPAQTRKKLKHKRERIASQESRAA